MLAPGVENVPGAGLDRDAEAEPLEVAGDAAGAGGEVRGERVEMHMVEGQRDAVVAEVGEEGEGIGQAEVGQAVGAVGEAQGFRAGTAHVALTFLDSRRATGISASSPAAVRCAPAREASTA
ncbi:hypothetical protein SANTM175S_02063 [Streptomyces antimycoticus]